MTKPELPPGPWSYNADNGQAIKDANGAILAYVLIRVSDECGPIFAAAQAALEVCEDVCKLPDFSWMTNQVVAKARAVLAAAYPDPPKPAKSLERLMAEYLVWLSSVCGVQSGQLDFIVTEIRASDLLEDK